MTKPKLQTLRPLLKTVRTTNIPTLTPGSWRTEGMSSTQRGYTYKWQQASKAFLAAHRLCECEDCQAGEKRVTVATVVDHRIPHRGDMALFWNPENWQAMAKPCHDKKTQRETAQGV